MLKPTFSIVIPSFNYARYLEECLGSLAAYEAKFCELVVMDGGSTDGSVDIIRKYDKRITYWQTRPDGGQAAALLDGFRRTSGRILGWLNSDDRMSTGALNSVARFFDENPQALWAYGNQNIISDTGEIVATRYVPSMSANEITWGDFDLPQESVFFRREFYFAVGEIDPHWRYAMDYALWVKMANKSAPLKMQFVVGEFRRHERQKTWSRTPYQNEVAQIRASLNLTTTPSLARRVWWYFRNRIYRLRQIIQSGQVLRLHTDVLWTLRRALRGDKSGIPTKASRQLEAWGLMLLGLLFILGCLFGALQLIGWAQSP